jgi:selenophosphate synthetase-related protein
MITCPEVRPVVSQYVDSPDFRAYLKTFTDEILLACNDLLDLENLFDIDSQEGEVLDLIGSIVGQPRIWVNNGDFVWFGYDSGNLDVSIHYGS